MLIGVVQETTSDETRVACVPETVKKLVGMGFGVAVETSAGTHARIPDPEFKTAGAKLVSRDQALASDIILKVRPPSTAEIATACLRGHKEKNDCKQNHFVCYGVSATHHSGTIHGCVVKPSQSCRLSGSA